MVEPVEVTVRDTQAADFPALQRIFRRASLSNAGDRPALIAHPEHLVLADDLVERGRTRVATLPDGTVIGFASSTVVDDGVLELDDLFVDPGWRRRGAAALLVRRIATEAAEERATRIDVTANTHAMAFYLAAGFTGDERARTPLGGGSRMHLLVRATE